MKKRVREKTVLAINFTALIAILSFIVAVVVLTERPPQFVQDALDFIAERLGEDGGADMPGGIIDAPFIYQGEKYPTGCESVSAVMALQYAGVGISVENFIDNYLEKGTVPYEGVSGGYYGPDPREVFLGDPYSPDGWGCYQGAVTKALKKLKTRSGYDFKYSSPKNLSLNKLCGRYIDKGVPVIIWATQEMQETREGQTWHITGKKESFTWIAPLHCLLLVGYDDTYYYFNDPQKSKSVPYEKTSAEAAYNALGRQAVVITDGPTNTWAG